MDHLLHAAHAQAVLAADHLQIGHARHLAVGLHDLDDGRRGSQPRKPAQIHAAFGLTRAHQHAAVARTQRIHVTGLHEVLFRRTGLGQQLDGGGTVLRAHAGADAVARVRLHAHREGGAAQAGVACHGGFQRQAIACLAIQRHAQVAATHTGHEIHHLGRAVLGSHHEVALVLALLVIDHHDGLAGAKVLQDLWNGRKRHRPSV